MCHSPAPNPVVNQRRVSPYEMTRPTLRRGPAAGANLGSNHDLQHRGRASAAVMPAGGCYRCGSCTCSKTWCKQEFAGAWQGQQQGLHVKCDPRVSISWCKIPSSAFPVSRVAGDRSIRLHRCLHPFSLSKTLRSGDCLLRRVLPCRGMSPPATGEDKAVRASVTLGEPPWEAAACGARGGGTITPCLVPAWYHARTSPEVTHVERGSSTPARTCLKLGDFTGIYLEYTLRP